MPKRNFQQAPNRLVYNNGREPVTAAMLSVIPGLGQLYNGQSIKGLLFIDVSVVNAGLLTIVLFAEPMAKGLRGILTGSHVKPNDGVLQALSSAHIGTPFSLVLLTMILLFVGFAVRDAYDYARGEKLKPIYADSALHLSEAASGSYLFHFAAMMCCAIFALFFLIPKPERQQIMEIEFTQTPVKDVAPVKPKLVSDVSSQAKPREQPVRKPTPSASTPSRSQPVSQPNRTQTPAPPRTAAKETPAKAAAADVPAVRPMPTAVTRPPAALNPNPISAPRPVPPSVTANTTPAPSMSKPTNLSAPTLLAMAPTTITGVGPTPLALSHSTNSAPTPSMPGEGKRPAAPRSNTGGPPAPAEAPSPSTLNSDPSPIAGTPHARGPAPSRGDTGTTPRKIASLLPPGPMVHPAGPPSTPSIPRPDITGSKPTTGTGKQDADVGEFKPDFSRYMAELQRRIKRNWMPPKDPTSRQVIVEFSISRSGELGKVRLSKSSGLTINDQAAITAIRNAAPFPPLPKGADEIVDIQFTFDYHIFGGRQSGGF